jgi:hypothetical protein
VKIKSSKAFCVALALFLMLSLINLNKVQATTYSYGGMTPGTVTMGNSFSVDGLTNNPDVTSVRISWVAPKYPVYDDIVTTFTTDSGTYFFTSPSYAPGIAGQWTIGFFFRNAQGNIVGQYIAYVNVIAPVYTISFSTSPASTGSINFHGTTYTDGQTGSYAGDHYIISANAPTGWTLDHWETTGQVLIDSNTPTNAQVNGEGTIKACFTFIPQNSAPEVPWGTIICSATMLVALAVFATLKMGRINPFTLHR